MKLNTTLIFSFISLLVFSQNQFEAYTTDYVFYEGLYLNVDRFKENNPISKALIVSDNNKSEIDFLKKEVAKEYIKYKDESNAIHDIKSTSLWGYHQNNTHYINYKEQFYRVNLIGTLCQFIAIVKVSVPVMNPMYPGTTSYIIRDEFQQIVYSVLSNKFYFLDDENLLLILKDDEELINEYKSLSRRKRKNLQFSYIRKYNEKHPLMLPVN